MKRNRGVCYCGDSVLDVDNDIQFQSLSVSKMRLA